MKPDKPDRRDEPERLQKPDRPKRLNRRKRPNCSGPDPCGLGASRCVIEFPTHSEKGPSKKSYSSGAGVIDTMKLLCIIRRLQ